MDVDETAGFVHHNFSAAALGLVIADVGTLGEEGVVVVNVHVLVERAFRSFGNHGGISAHGAQCQCRKK